MPSSVIKAWAYDPQGQVLTLTFVSGRVYAYQDVPADVAEGLRLAFAKGEYFNKAIRDRFAAVASGPGTASAQQPLI
jgi:hypothetical protein